MGDAARQITELLPAAQAIQWRAAEADGNEPAGLARRGCLVTDHGTRGGAQQRIMAARQTVGRRRCRACSGDPNLGPVPVVEPVPTRQAVLRHPRRVDRAAGVLGGAPFPPGPGWGVEATTVGCAREGSKRRSRGRGESASALQRIAW